VWAQIVFCSRLFFFIFYFCFPFEQLYNITINPEIVASHTGHTTDLFTRGVCMAGPDNGNGQIGEMHAIVSKLSFDPALATNMSTSSNTGLTCNFKWNV